MQNVNREVLTKIMQLSGIVGEIESNFNPISISSLSPQEMENLLKTMDNIIRACTDVKRYLS